MPVILVRYNELGLKSPKVRKRFQNKLVRNIQDSFLQHKVECMIDSLWGRIIVHTNDTDKGANILKKVFGISSISIAEPGTGGMKEIIESVIKYSETRLKSNSTFAIRARRYGNQDFTSLDLAEKLGESILNHFDDLNLKVKLKKPDTEIFVEVRNEQFYIFSVKIPGVGGFPIGTQGRILGIYENKDSLLAWWLMMKRGATIIPVYISEKSNDFDKEITGLDIDDPEFAEDFRSLQKWYHPLKIRFHNPPEKDEIKTDKKVPSRLTFYSYVINKLAEFYRVQAVVSGMTIEEFESELNTPSHDDPVMVEYPIFMPLVGFSSEAKKTLENVVLGNG